MKNYNGIIWIENKKAKTILSAVVVEGGNIIHGTEFSLKYNRPYSVEELQKYYPEYSVWLELREDAKELYKQDLERQFFQGEQSMNFKEEIK